MESRSHRTHKSVLPRITDAVNSALTLMHCATEGQGVTMFIADIVDAFWLIPLHPKKEVLLRKAAGEILSVHSNSAGITHGTFDICGDYGSGVDHPLVIIKGHTAENQIFFHECGRHVGGVPRWIGNSAYWWGRQPKNANTKTTKPTKPPQKAPGPKRPMWAEFLLY